MNEAFRRRLIGLAVLLVAVFALSLLLPRDAFSPAAETPTTTVRLADGEPIVPPAATPEISAAAAADTASPGISALDDGPADNTKDEAPAAADDEPAAAAPAAKPQPAKPAEPAAAPSPAPAPAPAKAEPAPPAKPTPTEPAVAASRGPAPGWYVQIGSFADAGNANTIIDLLKKLGYNGASTDVVSGNASLHRVRLGPFQSEAAARQVQARVTHQGYPGAIVVSEGNAGK